MSDAIYLYGFAPEDVALPAAGLAGVADRPVETVAMDGFAAVVGRVPAEEFTPAAVEQRLTDLAWVTAQGVEHERVVAWFVDHATILPVRLLTLYSGVDALRAEVSSRRETIIEQMRRFSGLHEWDLKVSYRAEVLRDHLGEVSEEVAALDHEIAAASPGKRYLMQRKRDQLVEVEIARSARRLATDLLESLAARCERTLIAPIPREAAELPVILRAALLVRADREPEIRDAAQRAAVRLNALGVETVFSGPWAPYRFMAGADDADRADTAPAAG